MQTKKRAKPVKFGEKKMVKKSVPDETPVEAVEKEEVKKTVETTEAEENSPEEAQVEEKQEEPEKPEEANEVIDKIEPEVGSPEFFNVPPDSYEKKKSIVPYFLLVMCLAFLLGLAFFYGIYYALNARSKNTTANQSPKPTSAATVTPENVTPTEKPIDLSIFTIDVLNGTETSGIAADLKTKLTEAGFKVGSVGNAEKTDYVKTEIAAKKNVDKKYLEKLREVVGKSYELSPISTLASGTADVVITIGSASAK